MHTSCMFFFYCSGDHRDLHCLTHSFPTRRSSDLISSPGSADTIHASMAPAATAQLGGRSHGLTASLRERTAISIPPPGHPAGFRSEEHKSELQSLMRISYAVFCMKKKNITT